jgi:hypothetical protein
MHRSPLQFVKICAACVGLMACGGGECVMNPCPVPFAIDLRVTSAAGAPLSASVKVGNAVFANFTCNSSCPVLGGAGLYELTIAAAGYVTQTKSVEVIGTSSKCGCPSDETQHVTIALAPATP